MNKTFDIGAKVYIDNNMIEYLDFFLISIDSDHNFAEILSGEETGEVLPLIFSSFVSKECIIPNFGPGFSTIDFKDLTINEYIDCLKSIFVGQKYPYKKEYLRPFWKDYKDIKGFVEDDSIDLVKLRAIVKESIVNQDELVDKVITSFVFNQRMIDNGLDVEKIRLSKKTLLVFGKTGTGKTEVMKQVAKELDVPYVIEDANKFTIDGYKGRDVSDMLLDLYKASNSNINEAENGVLIIDEFDKRCKKDDVSSIATVGVQQAILKIIEGDKFNLSIDKGINKEEIVFDTSKLTVFLMGSFAGIEKVKTRTIGFGSKTSEEDYTEDDLVNFGIIPELVGRISSVCKTNDLEKDDLKDIILNSKISILRVMKEIYSSFGVELVFTNGFIDKLCNLAYEKKVGARGIKNAFDEIFEEIEFNILNGDYSKVIFDKDKIRKIGSRNVEKSIEL